MKPKLFATESALCAAFTAALPEGWTAYAETAGWDLLLARAADGFQIGVQAKLKLNPFVLAQCLDETRYGINTPGPDCRAVLVPWAEVSVGLSYFCAYVGVTIVRMEPPLSDAPNRSRPRRAFDPMLPQVKDRWSGDAWHELAPAARCKLPEYIPDVASGARSPLQLTEWKIAALKIAILLEERGYVTRHDFKSIGIDHRRWLAPGNDWLRVEDGRFIAGKRLPRFKQQHPRVFEQIKADIAKWRPKDLVDGGEIGRLL